MTRLRHGFLIITLVAAALHSGCATTTGRRAAMAVYEGNYERAIPLLTAATIQSPRDAKTWARLGEAQYRTRRAAASRESFFQALTLDPALADAHVFLGFMEEEDSQPGQALTHYEKYLSQRPQGVLSEKLAQRAELLRRELARQIARETISRESQLDPALLTESSIGVVTFNGERLSEPLRPLTTGLAELLVTDFAKVSALHVVERTQTERILAELQMSESGAVDTVSAPRVGKLIGAAYLVTGDAAELGEGRLRFDPQLVSTKTGDIDPRKEQTGELAQFFRLEKRIVWDVLRRLGVEPTPNEKIELDRAPTESFVAFLAFSRGLHYQDLRQYRDAKREFERAASVDPSFQEAVARAAAMDDLTPIDSDARLEPIAQFVKKNQHVSEWAELPVRTDLRLNSLMVNSGMFRPLGSQRPDDPFTPPSTNTTLIINGRFDEPPD